MDTFDNPMTTLLKTPVEIKKMRLAGRLAAEVLEMITPYVQIGTTPRELDQRCHDYIVNIQKAIPALLEDQGFPHSICTSPNHVVCHGIPNDKPLKSGDILNIEVRVSKEGHHGDTSKMFVVGSPSIQAARLIRIARECLLQAIAHVKPGHFLGDMGLVIQHHAQAHHYSVVRDYCGHGMGCTGHEAPQVLPLGNPKTGMRLVPGMTFTLEPMITAGKKGVRVLPDGWTVVTKDRSLSAQWKHTLLVTESGGEVLTRREEESDLAMLPSFSQVTTPG